jgi:hypothetical protein
VANLGFYLHQRLSILLSLEVAAAELMSLAEAVLEVF